MVVQKHERPVPQPDVEANSVTDVATEVKNDNKFSGARSRNGLA